MEREREKALGVNRAILMCPVSGAMAGLNGLFPMFCRRKCMGITVVAAAGPEEEEISHR